MFSHCPSLCCLSAHIVAREIYRATIAKKREARSTLNVSTNTQRMLTGLSTRKTSLFLSLRMIITEVSRILQARNHNEQWIRLQNIHHSLRERQAAKPRNAGHDNSRTSRQRASRSHPLWLLIMPARLHAGQILLCGDILRHTLSVVPPDVQEPRFFLIQIAPDVWSWLVALHFCCRCCAHEPLHFPAICFGDMLHLTWTGSLDLPRTSPWASSFCVRKKCIFDAKTRKAWLFLVFSMTITEVSRIFEGRKASPTDTFSSNRFN